MSNAGSTLVRVLPGVIREGLSFEESWRVSKVEALYLSNPDVLFSAHV